MPVSVSRGILERVIMLLKSVCVGGGSSGGVVVGW